MNSSFPYSKLYRWYDRNRRELPWRETTNPYFIWLSEIILQQTRVAQGMEYYLRFIETYPTVQALAMAEEDNVLRLWQGLGYYSRARNLHRAARMVAAQTEKAFPSTYDELRALPGVGDYTAGAIAAFAYNLPHPALDGNVYRVLSRLTNCNIPFDTSAGKKHFHQVAEQLLDREEARLFNSAIMELGAIHCIPLRPDCDHCPLSEACEAYKHDTVEMLPVRKPRLKPREREISYLFYITPTRETLIHQRGTGDIWAKLWELVPSETVPDANVSLLPRKSYTHILSHQRIHATFRTVEVEELPIIPECKPVKIEDLDTYGFSKLTLRFLEEVL